MTSPVRFHEALQHIPANAIVLEVAPHALLQSVLRRSLPKTCTIVGLTDKRQTDNLVHFFASLGKYVYARFIHPFIGPILWVHSGSLCHALSLSSSSLCTSHAACAIAIAGVRLATPGDRQCNGGSQTRSSEWAQHFSNASCSFIHSLFAHKTHKKITCR